MRSAEVRRILKRHCRHHEEWHCGPAMIHFTGRDREPRFDRRIEIFLNRTPEQVDIRKISRLLDLLDRLGGKETDLLDSTRRRRQARTDRLFAASRQFAKRVGLKRSDVRRAVQRVRGR